MSDYTTDLKNNIEKAIEHFEEDLATIRTGRAHPDLVSGVKVDVYGSKVPLKQAANITVSDAKSLTVQPWDKANLSAIENSLRDFDSNLQVVNTGEVIHITLPDLTEERREEYKKLAKQKLEETKIAIRNARQNVWEETKKLKNDGEISEDEMYRREEEIQKIVDQANQEAEELYNLKEKELSEV